MILKPVGVDPFHQCQKGVGEIQLSIHLVLEFYLSENYAEFPLIHFLKFIPSAHYYLCQLLALGRVGITK